tara:strand:+ start:268 stop:891 length:624 start_codon:yes stop_codon:yes gene_type:complete
MALLTAGRLMGKRDDILDTAMALFNRHGYQAVGVDLIRDEAQVSKMTLYKYFATKEALVESVLRLRHERFKQSLELWLADYADPVERFKAVFNWHLRWFSSRQFYGCMFIKAAGEFHQVEDYLVVARLHKDWVRELLCRQLADMGVEEAATKASYLLVLLDGMIVDAGIFRSLDHVDPVWRCVCDCVGMEYAALDAPDRLTLPDSVF